MVNVVVSILLAMPVGKVHKVLPKYGDYIMNNNGSKIAVADADTIGVTASEGDGWRVYLMPQHKNIVAISPDTLVALWEPASGDANEYFLGAKAAYSFDGGATWSQYDLDGTNTHHRGYPSMMYDKVAGRPWFYWQELNSSVGYTKSWVAYDAAFPLGLLTVIELPNDSGYGLGDVFAKGDTVVAWAMGYGAAVPLKIWRSTDAGASWSEDVSMEDSLGGNYDMPFFRYDYTNNVLYLLGLNYNDDSAFVVASNDMGATWASPVWTAVPHDTFVEASWWYSVDGLVDNNGTVHFGVVMSPSGYENGILYDLKYDGSTWTETRIAGDSLYGDTSATAPFSHSARIPSMGMDANGNLYAIYSYVDTLTVNDTLYAIQDEAVSYSNDNGATWTQFGWIDSTGDNYAADMDEGRGEAASFIPCDANGYLHFNYYFAYDEDNYTTIFHYGSHYYSGVNEETKGRDRVNFNITPTVASGRVNVSFAMNKAGNVNIALYNVAGRRVAVLANGMMSAGNHTLSLNTSSLASGIYFVNMKTENGISTRKLAVR